MGEKRGTKALELWCRRITEGYPGVNVQNMTTSWKDGLAFCAMIHHFRPDLIDFNSLHKNDVYSNNELAFRIAEQHLGIPALLDAEDMASCSVPDRLSILTYLSQFYQNFAGSSPARLAVNRTTDTVDDTIVSRSESPKQKVTERPIMRRDLCAVCGLPVFLAEKLVVDHVAYHRTCFRCARCNNQLTIGNYYETEDGQFCCETCPDEDPTLFAMEKYNEVAEPSEAFVEIPKNNISDSKYQHSLNENRDSEVLDHSSAKSQIPTDYSIPDLIAQTSQLRTNFISNYLLSESNKKALAADSVLQEENLEVVERDISNLSIGVANGIESTLSFTNTSKEEEEFCSSSMLLKSESQSEKDVIATDENVVKLSDCDNLVNDNEYVNEIVSGSSLHNIVEDKSIISVTEKDDTKKLLDHDNENKESEMSSSLVQKRLKLFEDQAKQCSITREGNKSENKILNPKIQDKAHSRSNEDLKDSISETQTTDIQKISNKGNVSRGSTMATDSENSLTHTNNPFKLNTLAIDTNADDQETLSKSIISKLNMEEDKLNLNTPVVPRIREKESRKDQRFIDSSIEINQTYANSASTSTQEDYPEHLNPFKSDDEEDTIDIKCAASVTSMNSFSDEITTKQGDEREKKEAKSLTQETRTDFNSTKSEQKLLPKGQSKRRLTAPQISLNPFWSDEDDGITDLECTHETLDNVSSPKCDAIKYTEEGRGTCEQQPDLNYSNLHVSTNSLTTSDLCTSSEITHRKKKPAPLPPNTKQLSSTQSITSLTPKLHNESTGYHESPPYSVQKTRKTRPAPPPPVSTSSPCGTTFKSLNIEESPIIGQYSTTDNHDEWRETKFNKDEFNKTRRNLAHDLNNESINYKPVIDKSIHGKWKRKKGPAPPCPVPHRRKIKVISLKDVKLELDEIELQQQGLEKQGVRLEQLIRNKCESGPRADDVSLRPDVEELVLELFALVNEKNELFRRQAELMLLRRQQRLEEEYIDVEYQIRYLMSQHESTKTDSDKQREEALIQRLVEIVEKRNEIVESLEMDRRREIEEDRSINKHMDLFAARNKYETLNKKAEEHRRLKIKLNKSKDKPKEKKLKETSKRDVDKDVDETESKLKRHKRKWF
ncbi:MICAL-like protein [Calliopsis andreniformis]|uniref:MICAL-like protein n=1 Tax=Calliopsis andreniformis TaxID=337506 RepID=UPI003FCE41E9